MASWFKTWHRRQRRVQRGLRDGLAHRLLGDRLFHPHIWHVDERSIAGGFALGLFIAFTPTIPFQILLSAIGAILFRVNLTPAIAAVMITNPVTAVPVYLAASRLGRALCERTGLGELTVSLFGFHGRAGRVMQEGLFLWTGCLIFSLVSSVLGYFSVRAAWTLGARWRSGRRAARRRDAQPQP